MNRNDVCLTTVKNLSQADRGIGVVAVRKSVGGEGYLSDLSEMSPIKKANVAIEEGRKNPGTISANGKGRKKTGKGRKKTGNTLGSVYEGKESPGSLDNKSTGSFTREYLDKPLLPEGFYGKKNVKKETKKK